MHRSVLALYFFGSGKEHGGLTTELEVFEWDLTSELLSARSEDVSDGASHLADEIGGSCINVYDLERERLHLLEVEIELSHGWEKDAWG